MQPTHQNHKLVLCTLRALHKLFLNGHFLKVASRCSSYI